jgi:chemotaxis protein MotB
MARDRDKGQEDSGGSAEEAFATMFVSLNLILLSFFILLNAISIKDSARVRQAIGSLRGTFGILQGGDNPHSNGRFMMRGEIVEISKTKGRDPVEAKIAKVLTKAGLYRGSEGSVLVRTADGLRLEFAEPIAFRSGRTEIHPRLFPVLDELGKLIAAGKRKVVVRGYADGAPPRAYPTNLALSASRAAEVARYLLHAAGVPSGLLRAEGRGVLRSRKRGQRRIVEIFLPARSIKAPLDGRRGKR